ncbi:DDE-type integrase/transposase/recombinase [Micromonospora sp. MW-13]|uniref:DDE-type integrase/transposase/recombinase n=1 Tax=Micromonospora sp. MW-13 TaxID=2094022 RepID=UPI000E42E1A8|nr:DDE-type integrase/transposase/recombinase [Micromonospora sp. MW-13]
MDRRPPLVSARRDAAAARRFFHRALNSLKVSPSEVVTDANPVYPRVLDELVPSAWHHVERHANNPIETDHSQLTHRLRPKRGLRTDRTAQTIITGHAPSCRTSDADTTNSDPTSHPRYGWSPPSPN